MCPQIAICGFSIFFLRRKKTIDGILMTLGSSVTLAMSVFHQALARRWVDYDNDALTMSGAAGGIASFIFAAGFCILIYRILKSRKPATHEALDVMYTPDKGR